MRRGVFKKRLSAGGRQTFREGGQIVTRRHMTIELNKIRRAYQAASPTKRRQLRQLAMQIAARFDADERAATPSLLVTGAKKETRTNRRAPSLREED